MTMAEEVPPEELRSLLLKPSSTPTAPTVTAAPETRGRSSWTSCAGTTSSPTGRARTPAPYAKECPGTVKEKVPGHSVGLGFTRPAARLLACPCSAARRGQPGVPFLFGTADRGYFCRRDSFVSAGGEHSPLDAVRSPARIVSGFNQFTTLIAFDRIG
jgi:hypothetical protein